MQPAVRSGQTSHKIGYPVKCCWEFTWIDIIFSRFS